MGTFHLHQSALEERLVVTTLEGHFKVLLITHMTIKVTEKLRWSHASHVKLGTQGDRFFTEDLKI